ncbi:C-C motif chemokine 24 [Trichosurus vulpecula]|uniref:C-C motif chemokine 24 n=1 Tax=Trichosurus vulpecula TaxID=9337 RepID=UPI00186B45A2|nr:C-C motif chemokine 24 [Trichosurus vulpecula]
MKTSIVILLHLLLMVICYPTAYAAGASVVPSLCCTKYAQKAFPASMLLSYQVTNRSACSMPGVVFITKKFKEVCADPARQWVKDRMKTLDAREAKPVMVAGPKALKKTLRKQSSNSTTLDH